MCVPSVPPATGPSGAGHRSVRYLALALLCGAAVALERLGLVSLLAWTEPIIPSARLPWLFAVFLATCAAAMAVPPRRPRARRAGLLAGSLAAIVLFDPSFAAVSLAFLLAFRRLVHSRLPTAAKVGALAAAFAGGAVACDAFLFPGPLAVGGRLWLGYAFACQ